MPTPGSPVARRRELGAMLRARRTALGLTVEEAAKRLLISPSKLSRVETGQRNITARDARDLGVLYAFSEDERTRVAELSAGGKARAWWQPFNLPYSYETYLGLEGEATSIRDFAIGVIPGLLQTQEYGEATTRAVYPGVAAETLEGLVRARLERQRRVLHESGTKFTAMIDEGALLRVAGGAAVMRDQVRNMLEAAELPRVDIRIVPFAAGPLPAPVNKFIILGFDGNPDVVFLESLTGQLVLERESDLAAYRGAYEALERLAISADESYERLRSLQRGYA